MILNLVPSTNQLLSQELELFDFKTPPCDPIELANNLIETMTANKGIGLAANQCGLPYRVFALWSEKPLVCFNPRIVDQSSEGVMMDEGCLTYPNLFIKIRRPKIIKVRFQDATGEMQNERFVGMTARGFLHELDHLNGILYHRRALGPHLARAKNQQKQLERKLKRGEVYYKASDLPNIKVADEQQSGTLTLKQD